MPERDEKILDLIPNTLTDKVFGKKNKPIVSY